MHLNTYPRPFLALPLLALLGPLALPVPAALGPVRAQSRPGPATVRSVQNTQTLQEGREIVTPSGVRYVDLRVGEGDEAANGKIVEVHYIGWLEGGAPFDSTRDHNRPLTFRLGAGDALKGWDEGLAGMRVGGKRKLVIPPSLGFGKEGVGGVVPPNAVLFYEFELLGVR